MARGIAGSYGTRTEGHPNRRPTPPGGASASGLMRLSGIGEFDQGAPGPPPRSEWGTPLDPTHGATPGWDPGEAWPTYYNSDTDDWVPSTQNPGLYTSGTGETRQLPTAIGPQFDQFGGGDFSGPQQLEVPQQVSNFGPVGDFINRMRPREIA